MKCPYCGSEVEVRVMVTLTCDFSGDDKCLHVVDELNPDFVGWYCPQCDEEGEYEGEDFGTIKIDAKVSL